jgi:hypothetical protein
MTQTKEDAESVIFSPFDSCQCKCHRVDTHVHGGHCTCCEPMQVQMVPPDPFIDQAGTFFSFPNPIALEILENNLVPSHYKLSNRIFIFKIF